MLFNYLLKKDTPILLLAKSRKSLELQEERFLDTRGTKDNLLLSVVLPFLKEFLPNMAEELFQEIMTENAGAFEGFLKALLKNRIQFFIENKEILQVIIKEMLYNEKLKKDILPYVSENIIMRLNSAIEIFKNRGELVDIPNNQIIKMVLSFLGGFFNLTFYIVR